MSNTTIHNTNFVRRTKRMPPKAKGERKSQSPGSGNKNRSPGLSSNKNISSSQAASGAATATSGKTKVVGAAATTTTTTATENDLPQPKGYLISCDIPTKQYIQYLNVLKEPADKKFVLEDLDATHLLVKTKAKDEILRKVEDWEDSNVYSAIEKVGEDFDMS